LVVLFCHISLIAYIHIYFRNDQLPKEKLLPHFFTFLKTLKEMFYMLKWTWLKIKDNSHCGWSGGHSPYLLLNPCQILCHLSRHTVFHFRGPLSVLARFVPSRAHQHALDKKRELCDEIISNRRSFELKMQEHYIFS
jgi:hypothetical protein